MKPISLPKAILECVGKRVWVRTAFAFDYHGVRYLKSKVEWILAVLSADTELRVIDPIERCQWCKSKGEGNMMLDHAGYCILCHRNKYGELQESTVLHPKASPLTDDERERFGGFLEDHLNKERPKGTIVSFAGQKKRTHAEPPPLIKAQAPTPSMPVQQAQPQPEGRIVSAASLRKRSRY